MNLVIRERSTNVLETAWGAELRSLEARIQKAEGEGVALRWRSGQWMFQQRKGKQFPKGFLDRTCRHLKISRRELSYRIRLGDKYATKDELSNAVAKFPTWHAMTQHGLTNPARKPRTPAPVKPVASFELHRIEKLFTKLQPERQTPANIECLRRIHAQLGHVLEAALRMLATLKQQETQHA